MLSRGLSIALLLGFAVILTAIGCSGGGSPLAPDNSPYNDLKGAKQIQDVTTNRYLWGMWEMQVNDDHTHIDVVPMRESSFHLNITGYLENPPGTQLVRIVDVSLSEYDTVLVDIQLIHPFKNNKGLTGFDVRGIAIMPAANSFGMGKLFTSIIENVDGDPENLFASRQLVNADGYTTLWNRHTAPVVDHPGIFGYIPGRLSIQEGFIEGNLHGYKAFWTDSNRRVFQSNQSSTRTYEFKFPAGPLRFAYSVDCSWDVPINKPVVDIFADFPISANSWEPYQISASLFNNTLTKTSGSVDVVFEVFDWQDATNFSNVFVEAPDLFFGTIDPGGPFAYGANSALYQVTIPNMKGNAVTAGGGSDLLIAVEDAENSTVNPDLTAYQIIKVPVADVPGFWRDRNGDGTFVNVPLQAPLVEPSTMPGGKPDISVISYPDPAYDFFNGKPEILLFDDDNSPVGRFIVYNRTLTSTQVKSGYPYNVNPPSWLNYPHSMDTTPNGFMGVGSSSTVPVVGNYLVKHIMYCFNQGGVSPYGWHTGTDSGGAPFLETIRDVTNGFGNVVTNPLYGLYAYESGSATSRVHVLMVGDPYNNPANPNVLRTWLPKSNTGGVPNAIYADSERLRCAIDTDAVGLNPLHYMFYVLESNPSSSDSEIQGFDINFSNLDPVDMWNLSNAQIQAEFPGAWAVDIEVVPSHFNKIETYQGNTAKYNWLAVLMTNGVQYWVAFYDPLNPSPDNPGNTKFASIYKTNSIVINAGGPAPVAMDVDMQYFEVYTLLQDSSDKFYMTVFEFFY